MLIASLTARQRAAGFTLVELLVVMSVIGVSVALVAPNFSQMLAGYQVRSGAEGVLNGLNYARAEAVRRNTPVSFQLDGGAAWSVQQVAPSTELQARAGGGSTSLSFASSNESVSVTFLPTGVVAPGDRLEQIEITSSVAATNGRRISVLGGGLIRMCDPNASATDDPRRC